MFLYSAFLALSAFLITLLGTRLLILTLRRMPVLMDMPIERSNHRVPTPKGGGIAVVAALVIYLFAADIDAMIVAVLLLLAAISLMDDWIEVSPWARLTAQLIGVLAVMQTGEFSFFTSIFPYWLDQLIIIVGWLWFINLFNFMDGIDGITAVEAISIAAGICLITTLDGTFGDGLPLWALILLSTASGFLWWNRHPAKIFLGDVGSIPLGFLIFYLLLLLAKQGYGVAALILPSYYLMDASITLVRRVWRSEKIMQAHSSHFYQLAARALGRHDVVVRYIFGINMLLIALAAFSILFEDITYFCLGVGYATSLFLLWYFTRLDRLHKES